MHDSQKWGDAALGWRGERRKTCKQWAILAQEEGPRQEIKDGPSGQGSL